jgi:hypothetical protein
MARPKNTTIADRHTDFTGMLDARRDWEPERIAADLRCSVQTLVRHARRHGYELVTTRRLERHSTS